MKKLFISLSLLLAMTLLAQDGFRNESGKLIWQHAYPAGTNINAVLETQPGLQVVAFINNTYTGSGNEVKNTCNTGSSLMKNNCKFDFQIQVNPDGYIVTVTNLKIIERLGPMQARIMANRCEKYFVDAALNLKKDDRTQDDINCLNNLLLTTFSSGTITENGVVTAN